MGLGRGGSGQTPEVLPASCKGERNPYWAVCGLGEDVEVEEGGLLDFWLGLLSQGGISAPQMVKSFG